MSARHELLEAGRRVVEAGLSPGSSGNLSVREGDRVFITRTGASLGALTLDDLAEVSMDGTPVGGPRPSKEVPLHLAFYGRDDAFRAVAHLHSPSAVAASCLEPWREHSSIPPLTPYFVMRVGQTPLLPYRHPGDEALGADLSASPWDLRAALLANHGSVVAGETVEQAFDRAVELEEACRIALLTATLPRRELDEVQAAELAARWGTPWNTAASLH